MGVRSTNSHLLAVPSCPKCSFASRAICVSSPNNWNSLPLHICSSDSLATFQSRLKTKSRFLLLPITSGHSHASASRFDLRLLAALALYKFSLTFKYAMHVLVYCCMFIWMPVSYCSHGVGFCSGKGGDVPSIYAVDSSIEEDWDTSVRRPSSEILSSFLRVLLKVCHSTLVFLLTCFWFLKPVYESLGHQAKSLAAKSAIRC